MSNLLSKKSINRHPLLSVFFLTMLRSIFFILFIGFLLSDSKKKSIERMKQSYFNDDGRDVINSSIIDSTEGSKIYMTDKNGKLNRDRVILFWNTFYGDGWFNIGRKYEPFQTCPHKNCFTTRDRSLLTNPNFIVDAVVFFGVQCPHDDLRKIKQFKESEEIIQQKNTGMKPKIVLFMTVRL